MNGDSSARTSNDRAYCRCGALESTEHGCEVTYGAMKAERDRLRAALERMSKWKGHAGDVARKALSGEPGSAVETCGDGLSIDETRFLAALAGVKPPAGSPGGHTAYGRTLIERVWDEYQRLKDSERPSENGNE